VLTVHQPVQAFSAVGRSPGKHLPAEAGTPDYSYPDYVLNVHQPDQTCPAVGRSPGKHATG